MLGDIVDMNQAAFVRGRHLQDNGMLAHELVHGYSRKNVSPWAMLKVDIQKAYDSVEWPFIERALRILGFRRSLCA